jgi:hypothetical protein
MEDTNEVLVPSWVCWSLKSYSVLNLEKEDGLIWEIGRYDLAAVAN